MYSSKVISALILFALILSLPVTAVENTASSQIAGRPADAVYPFIAEVTGSNVYVRSGKGTAYYQCGKVNLADKLTVVGEAFGWAEILPPKGSYSWIHKNYVNVKKELPTVGVLKGDNVRVWAGSDMIEADRSSSMQTKLNTGQVVKLFADQPADSEYYKIVPPAGAKLAISCTFLKYVGPAAPPKTEGTPPRTETKTPVKLPASTEAGVPAFGNVDKDAAATDKTSKGEKDSAQSDALKAKAAAEKGEPGADEDSPNMKACYALSAKIDEELKKPLTEQKYDSIRKEIEVIKADTSDTKGATFAQILLERIGRYELAISVTDTLKDQDESLTKTKDKIEKTHKAQLKKVHKEADYIYTGVLKVSHVYTSQYGQKRYLLKGPSGKILCYAIPKDQKAASQFESLLGKRVGIKGKVSSDSKALVTLITTTVIEPI